MRRLPPPILTVLLSVPLGALPFLLWGVLGFAGGPLLVPCWLGLAIYVGWRLHRDAEEHRRWQVLACATAAAATFLAVFAWSSADFPAGVPQPSLTKAIFGAVAGFAGVFVFAAAIIGVGLAARHARST